MMTLAELTDKVMKNLSKAEADTLHSLQNGEVANPGKEERIDLDNAEKWGEERTIRSDFVLWLCTDPSKIKKLTPHGIRIKGARIESELILRDLQVPLDISFYHCFIPEPIDFRNSIISSLDLSGSRTGRIDADCLTVHGDLRFDKGFRAEGPVCLREAVLNGDLSCTGGNFDNLSDRNNTTRIIGCVNCRASMLHCYALVLERARVEGSIFLCGGFTTKGGVHLGDTAIGANLNCTNGKFNARELEAHQSGKTTGRRLVCKGDSEHHLACAFNGEGMRINGNLIMNGVEVKGETRLTGARVGGDLDSADGKYYHPSANAIHGDRLHVKGNAFFCDGFEAKGAVRLPRAKIGSDLSFYDANLATSSKDSCALFCKGINVMGSVYLNKSVVQNSYTDLSNSSIEGNLDCADCTFLNPDGWALKAKGMYIKGSIFLNSSDKGIFKAEGVVALTGSQLGMDLICSNGRFKSAPSDTTGDNAEYALMANNMIINGKVEMEGKDFSVTGGVSLDNTRIASYLSCEQGTFKAPPPRETKYFAISAGKLQAVGSIYLGEGFKAEGEVMLNDASTERNLNLSNASITNLGGKTLQAMQLKVAGSVNMDSFISHGEVLLDYAVIGGNLICKNGEFSNNQQKDSSSRDRRRYAFNANGVKIAGNVEFNNGFHIDGIVSLKNADIGMRFIWMNIKDRTTTALYLDAAKAGVLDDEEASWPDKNNLQINEFEYRFLMELSPEGIKKRRKQWLGLPRDFRTQPYEHLASVLRQSGYEEEAKEVLIEKHKAQIRLPTPWPWLKWLDRRCPAKDDYRQSLKPITKILRSLFGALVGYGYKPSRAAFLGLFLILIGWGLFNEGFKHNVMVSTKDKDKEYIYQTAQVTSISDNKELKTITDHRLFYSFIYAVDTFLPVVDFHAAEYWLPTDHSPEDERGWGHVLCLYRWFLIISGWVISICYGAALSGIVRR